MDKTTDKSHGSNQSGFMQTVDDIRKAEHESESLKAAAKEKADAIARKGREAVMKAESETEQAITDLKNHLVKKGNEEVEKEVEKILSEAKKEADKARAAELDRKRAQKIASGLIFLD